jgi:hypothetical protein
VPRLVFGERKALRLPPIALTLTEPAPVPSPLPEAPRRTGLLATVEAGGAATAACVGLLPDEAAGPNLEKQAGAAKADRIRLEGEIEAPAAGTWQLDLTGNGKVTVEIGGRTVLADADLKRMQFAAADLPAGWHPIRITLVPAGPPRLFAALAGGKVHGPAAFRHASRPLAEVQPAVEGAEAGKPLSVAGNGIVLSFKAVPKNLAAVVLTPDPNTEGFPGKWIVEVPAGRDKWKEAEGVTALVGPPAGKAPAFLELSFGKPVKAARLRLRPAEGAATLAKIEALSKGK